MIENLKSVAVFAKVAETGSFTAAAKALKMSAPVVSQHISQLEGRLDTALIYRSTRSLSLTDAGQRFATHARKMLDALEDGFDDLGTDYGAPKGALSVALPALIMQTPFMNGIAEYAERYPEVSLRISFDDNFRDLVREGYDVGIRGGELDDSTLKAKKLLDGQGVLVATPKLAEKLGHVKHPEALMAPDVPWIGTLMTQRKNVMRNRASNEVVDVLPKPRVNVDNTLAGVELMLRGLGVGYVPKFYFDQFERQGKLVQLLPDWETDRIGVYAVWPANAGSRSLSRHLINFLVEEFLPRLPTDFR